MSSSSPAHGLSRHASQVEQVGQHLRDLRETTAALTSQLGDKPMGETTKLILELGRSQLFKAMLAQVQNPEEAVDIDMLKNAMLAAQRLESTAMQSHKRGERDPPGICRRDCRQD